MISEIYLFSMIIFLIFLYQFTGEFILHLNKIVFKKKIKKLNLLEHFIFGLILGILINTLITIFIVFIIPFNLIILIIVDLILILVGFLLNNKSFKDFFWIRLINYILSHEKLIETKKYFKKYLIYIIFLIIIDLYLSFIIQTDHIQVDLLDYAHHSLDSIRNGWNYYDPTYLAKKIYYTDFFSFLIIPFYSINSANWMFITDVYLYRLQFYIFFSLVFLFSYRLNPKLFFLPLVLYLSTFHFLTWFSYVLPSNFNLILILILIYFIFDENIKSNFISIFILICMFFMHATSLIMIFAPPLTIILLIKFFKSPESFYLYKKFRLIKRKLLSISKIYRILIIITFVLLVFLITLSIFPYFIYYFKIYLSVERDIFNPVSFFDLWNNQSFGLPLIIGLSCGIILGMVYFKEKIKITSFICFFLAVSLYMTLILSNYSFWRQIIRTPYLEYRFMVYLDFSLFLLAPFFLSLLNILERVNIQKLKKKNNKLKKLFFNKIGTFSFSLLLLSTCTPKIIINNDLRFNFSYFSKYWPTGYHQTIEFVNNVKLSNSTYMFNPEGNIYTAEWNFFHTYLGDTRCIHLDELIPFYNDSLYSYTNPYYSTNYNIFINFIFNETKNIYPYIANYKNLDSSLRTTLRIDFIFIDSASNENLINLMLNDLRFKILFNVSSYWYRTRKDVLFYVFEPINDNGVDLSFISEIIVQDKNCGVDILDEYLGHKYVIRFYDNNYTGYTRMRSNFGDYRYNPTIEFYFTKNQVNSVTSFSLYFREDHVGNIASFQVNYDDLYYYNGTNGILIKNNCIAPDKFTHIKINFDDDINKFFVFVNQENCGNYSYRDQSVNGINHILAWTYPNYVMQAYIDTVLYSWI